jgi:hypothetical protein
MTKRRTIRLHPDAERPGWELFIDDGLFPPSPVSFAGSYTFGVFIRTPASVYSVAGTFTAAASPTLDRDQADDVPSLTFEPATGALASLTGQRSRAVVMVLIGTGGVLTERHDFPAQVIP